MSPLIRIYLWPFVRTTGPWLLLQPFFTAALANSGITLSLMEGQMCVFGALLGIGAQASLPRERMEYLRQLPFRREEIHRFVHRAAMTLLVAVALLDHLGHMTGLAAYSMQWVDHRLAGDGTVRLELETHFGDWACLNLLGLPVLAYWITTLGLLWTRRLTRVLESRTYALVPVAIALFMILLPVFQEAERGAGGQDLIWRNVPGAVGLLLARQLWRLFFTRIDRIGIDAYPPEGLSWES